MAVIGINNGDDFKIILKIKGKDGVVIPYNEIYWVAHYYTTEKKILRVSGMNGVLSDNCEIIGEEVHVYVDGFDWEFKGRIYRRVYVSFEEEKFKDGVASFSTAPVAINYKII